MRSSTTLLAILLGVALLGCGDGSDGSGGSGGGAPLSRLRFVHLAPDVPSAQNTAVDVLVDGETRAQGVSFEQATEFFSVDSGEQELVLAEPGSSEPLLRVPLELAGGETLTAVAYHVSDEDPPLAVLLLDGSLDGLEAGQGRAVIAHGADEAIVSMMNVFIDAPGACPPALVSSLAFGDQVSLDLQAATYPLGFSIAPTAEVCSPSPLWPVLAGPVEADVATLWIAVDRDTREGFLDPAVYALVAEASGQVPDLDPVSR